MRSLVGQRGLCSHPLSFLPSYYKISENMVHVKHSLVSLVCEGVCQTKRPLMVKKSLQPTLSLLELENVGPKTLFISPTLPPL